MDSPGASPGHSQQAAALSSAASAQIDGGDGTDEKPRLTEAEKKQNHIASEQKRRQAIREGFDRLTELVPGLEGQGRSEGLVLQRTGIFMREQLEERRRLIERIEAAGGQVDPELKRALQQITNWSLDGQSQQQGNGSGSSGAL